jgi:hypothetical protein
MDSSINTAKPYTEKKPPRRKAPVRKPRAPKEPGIMPVITSLISPVEREVIKSAQKRLEAGSKIARAIKSKIVRTAIKNNTAIKAMNKAGNVLAGNTIARLIKAKIARDSVVKVPKATKPKNEIVPKKSKNEIVPKVNVPTPKPKKERKPKPIYKMSYATAVKAWNASRGNAMWCSPKKGSDEYKAVQALRL